MDFMPDDIRVDSAPHRWRVLKGGKGPVALCLHGAGGTADSFRPLMTKLASDLTMIAPDLPGHGATLLGAPNRSGLTAMADDVTSLVRTLGVTPEVIIGHSAGAAIALMSDSALSPRGQILLNAALSGFTGIAGWVFPAMAKGLSVTPFAAELLSRSLASEAKLRSLLNSTGTKVTPDILARYSELVRNVPHIRGTLKMMAAWDLSPLLKALPSIRTRTLLIAGDRDGTVPVSVSNHAEKTLSDVSLKVHHGGHLLHEEDPEIVAEDIRAFLAGLDLIRSG